MLDAIQEALFKAFPTAEFISRTDKALDLSLVQGYEFLSVDIGSQVWLCLTRENPLRAPVKVVLQRQHVLTRVVVNTVHEWIPLIRQRYEEIQRAEPLDAKAFAAYKRFFDNLPASPHPAPRWSGTWIRWHSHLTPVDGETCFVDSNSHLSLGRIQVEKDKDGTPVHKVRLVTTPLQWDTNGNLLVPETEPETMPEIHDGNVFPRTPETEYLIQEVSSARTALRESLGRVQEMQILFRKLVRDPS